MLPGPAVHGADELRRFLRRHGVDRLQVVDASVRPAPPAANTIAAVLAIAEQAAGSTGTAA
ncbi:GMC family oxidoreductase [Streptomyces sp. NBC_00510]